MAEVPGAVLALSFALGAIIGSFLNVVIHRLPRGASIVGPRSACPSCARTIPAWANVPIVSWILLRGRCHRCGWPIPLRYPLVELATALLFVALLLRWEPGVRLIAFWAVGAALIAIAFIDAEHRIIPDRLTLPGIPIGLALAWLAPPPGLLDALLGAVLVAGMMFALAVLYERSTGRVGLGMGDVKLMAMLGTFLGLQATLGVLVIGSLLGLLHALPLLALRRAGRQTPIPFGPSLAAAGILHLYAPDLLPAILPR